MKIGVKVGDVMTRSFIHSNPATSISKCANEMIKNNVGSLIIKDKAKLVGLLTSKDILRVIVGKKDISKINAEHLVTRKIATIRSKREPPGEVVEYLFARYSSFTTRISLTSSL